MIAKRTLFGGLGDGVQETSTVRTGLNAKGTADAVFRVNQHRTIRRAKCRANGANLNARRVLAKIAQLRHEKGVFNLILRQGRRRESGNPVLGNSTIRRIHDRLATSFIRAGLRLGYNITLNPSAKIRSLRHTVLFFAGFRAQTATDALTVINAHQPFMLGRVVALGRAAGNKNFLHRRLGRARRSYGQQTSEGTAHSQQ